MKKIAFLLLATAMIGLSSCGEDSPIDPGTILDIGLSGTVTYNGENYTIKNGVFSQQERDGAAEAQFFLADGVITPSTNGVSAGDSKIIISITAFSKGAAVINDGDYATSSTVPDQYCFVTVTTIGESRVNKQSFVGGTVSISGSDKTYTTTFDVPFGQGIKLTGTVSGTYVAP